MSDFEPYDPVVDPFAPLEALRPECRNCFMPCGNCPKTLHAAEEMVEHLGEANRRLTEALTQIANPRKQGDPSPPEIARCALGWPAHNVEQSPEAALDEIAALIKDRPMRFQADWVMRDWYAKIDAWWVAQYAIDHPGGLG